MKQSEFDWQYLRMQTLFPLLTAAVSVILVAASMWLYQHQQRVYSNFAISHAEMHEDYDALIYRRRLVDRYHRRYQQFHQLGFVGRESRLDWVETMRVSTENLLLPRVNYAIAPQLQVIAPVDTSQAGQNIHIHLSRLDLELGLVHEIDLLRFFDQLQSHAPGLTKVDKCDLQWQADPAAALGGGINIQAKCSLMIFSVITSDVASAAL